MAHEPPYAQALSLHGEVIEIFERQGTRFAKVTIGGGNMLGIRGEGIREAHLGDRVVIEGSITIENIKYE